MLVLNERSFCDEYESAFTVKLILVAVVALRKTVDRVSNLVGKGLKGLLHAAGVDTMPNIA